MKFTKFMKLNYALTSYIQLWCGFTVLYYMFNAIFKSDACTLLFAVSNTMMISLLTK